MGLGAVTGATALAGLGVRQILQASLRAKLILPQDGQVQSVGFGDLGDKRVG